MSASPASSPETSLRERLARRGREFAAREAEHAEGVASARRCAEALRARVCEAVEAFERAAAEAGGSPLGIEVSAPRLDDKHVRSVQFDLRRGRNVAIVTAKSRGDVTLVGPFHAGKTEGPCASYRTHSPDDAELARGLAAFLERFLDEATAP